MQAYRWTQAEALVERINSLREPYRGNAIAWLERCTHQPLKDVGKDLYLFLDGLNPAVRDRFMYHTRMILDDAIRFFGESSASHGNRAYSLNGAPVPEER
jgi:hypothetical protein